MSKLLIIREWASTTPAVNAILSDRYGEKAVADAEVLRRGDELTTEQIMTENIVILAEIYNNVYHIIKSMGYLTEKQNVFIILQNGDDVDMYDMRGSKPDKLFGDFAVEFMKRNHPSNFLVKSLVLFGVLIKYATVFGIEHRINPRNPIGVLFGILATICVVILSVFVGVFLGPFLVFSQIFETAVLNNFKGKDTDYWTKKFSIKDMI